MKLRTASTVWLFMVVTESAADTVLLAVNDTASRHSIGQALSRSSFWVIEAEGPRSAMDLLRFYSASVEWLIVDIDRNPTCPGLHVALEYRYFNPLRPVICFVDGAVPAALLRLPDIVVMNRQMPDLALLLDVMSGLRAERMDVFAQ